MRLYKESFYLEELISISEGLRIPEKYESAVEETHKIVKQYQFSKYSKIAKGSYISEKQLSKVLSDNSERYSRIMQDKIIIAEDALEINSTIDNKRRIPQGGVYFAVLKNENLELKLILAILNSRLLSFLYSALYSGMHMGGGYLRYRSRFLEKLPVKKNVLNLSKKQRLKIIDLVDHIYEGAEQNKVQEYEHQIDQMVYKLYGLTEEEIKIVENFK